MSSYRYWVHGNAVAVESPEALDYVLPRGWGTQLGFPSRGDSWLHVPLPTPAVEAGVALELRRVFLLCGSDPGDGQVISLHVFDGSTDVEEFDRSLAGDHPTLTSANTFELSRAHPVRSGIGVTFRYLASVSIDEHDQRGPFTVYAAGAEYDVASVREHVPPRLPVNH